MAKLGSSYCLCPIIDQKNFLGVSEDSVGGNIIVTLGRNIVIRYKLSDQKQVNSWSSKDRLSAPVVYDYIGKRYIGIFNLEHVTFWNETSIQLNKLKKYRFVMLIHCVLTAPGIEPVIVFKNGYVSPLSVEFECRSKTNCIPPLLNKEEIEDAKIVNLGGIYYVCLLIQLIEKSYRMWFVPVTSDEGEKSVIEMSRSEDVKLTSYTVMDVETFQLITFWSDGKMFSLDLPLNKDSQSLFPGRFISLLPEINPLLPVAMVTISQVHVAIYGSDPNSEGAVLAIYNIKFGVIQTSSHCKLYMSSCPKLWRCGNSQLVLVMGSYLTVAPYHLAVPRMAAMVGAHLSQSLTHPPVVSWDKKEEDLQRHLTIPGSCTAVERKIGELRESGITERAICNEVMPTLLEKLIFEDIKLTIRMLNEVPEHWVFRIVVSCLKALPKVVIEKDEEEGNIGIEKVGGEEKMEIEEESNGGQMEVNGGHDTSPPSTHGNVATQLLLEVLEDQPLIQDTATLVMARNNLDLPNALCLLRFISSHLDDSYRAHRLLEWAALLLDSHYQQYILSKDSEVKIVLNDIKNAITKYMEYVKDFQILDSYLLQLQKGICFTKKKSVGRKSYLVEKIRLL